MVVSVALLAASLLAALAAWVLAARAADRASRTLAALLLLFAGATLAFRGVNVAASMLDAQRSSRVALWYLAPTVFLIALLLDQLFLPRPRSRPRAVALGLAGAATFGVLATLALAPGLLVGAAEEFAPGRWIAPAQPPTLALIAAIALVEALAVLVAARCASDPARSPLQQRQAALVGIAFGLLVAHAGTVHVASALDLPNSTSDPGIYGPLGAVETMVVLASARSLLRPLRGSARSAAGLALAAALVDGLANASTQLAVLLNAPTLLRETTGRPFWQMLFAAALALAVIRYGLPGVARGPRARAEAWAALVPAAPLAVAAAAVALDSFGPGLAGLGLAGASVAGLGALVAVPRLGPRRLARRLLLDAADPAVMAERARVYAAALRSEAAAGGDRPPPATDARLLDLRRELGLTDRDHALLAGMLDERREALVPGAWLLGRYRIVRELGRGGFGEAFLARDEREGRDVVLKRLAGERRRDAEALRRFRKEARLAGLLEHPHVVRVLGVEDVRGEPLLVMEYAPGGSLADRLRAGPLPEAEAVRVGIEVLDALGALHAAGIVHRDVKPSNILFDAQGRAKLGDFTLAREVVSGETRGGAPGLQGTFPYLAPEQARGLPAGPAADLYALGATLYEAVSGTPPFDTDGRSEHEAALLVTQRLPPLPVPHASAGLSAAIARALAKDPQARFRGAEAMASELRRGPPRAGGQSASIPRQRRRPA